MCQRRQSSVALLWDRRKGRDVFVQPAGAAEAPVPSDQGAVVRRQAREHTAHVPAVVSVPSHAALPRRHEERGEGRVGAARLTEGGGDEGTAVTNALPLSPVQLLSSMTECLCVDVQSLGVWRQLYTKHLAQSR